MSRTKGIRRTVITLLTLALLLELTGLAYACTTAILSGRATTDGRPVLWKNRDVSNAAQEMRYWDGGPIPFISDTYFGDTARAYMGVNLAGFAIGNADAANFRDTVHTSFDDGYTMKWALSHCTTVWDFQAFLDSTNVTGRDWVCCYNVFDAYGNAGYFEVANYAYWYYDATDPAVAPDGWLVRANFAISGNLDGWAGLDRYERAREIIRDGTAAGTLNAAYVVDRCTRDLHSPAFDPYPLPPRTAYGGYPVGYVPAYNSINRSPTVAAAVIQGVRAGEDPRACVQWIVLGSPCLTPAVPCWVYAGSIPPELGGPALPLMNAKSREFRSSVWSGSMVDTRVLVSLSGDGLLDRVRHIESWLFAQTAPIDEGWLASMTDRSQLTNMQTFLSAEAYRWYANGVPTLSPDDAAPADDPTLGPNPTNGPLMIQWRTSPVPETRLNLLVMDCAGTVVQRIDGEASNAGSLRFDLPEPAGVYFVRLEFAHQKMDWRVVRY